MTTMYEELMSDPEFKKEYAIEGTLADSAELIWQLLVRRGMKQADLARALKRSPAFVSQLLSGQANMTVHTLAEVVYTLGASLKLDAIDLESEREEADQCNPVHTFQLPATKACLGSPNAFRYEPNWGTKEGSDISATLGKSEYVA